MAKIDDEIAALKADVNQIKNDMSQINFNILRMLSEIGKLSGENIKGVDINGGSTPVAGSGGSVDLGPIEERLDELTKKLVKKEEIDMLASKVEKMASERIKEAEDTIKRVTTLFQSGLEMVKLESTLADVKSLLEESIAKN
jgi:hypothetical protein